MPELNPESELIRAVIANADSLSEVTEIVSPRDFFSPSNRVIYETTLEGWANNKPVDPMILASELERKGLLETAGGMDKIMDLSFGNPSQASYFARRVRDRGELYRMKQIATELGQRASTDGADPDELREWLDEATHEIAGTETSVVQGMEESLDATLDKLAEEDSDDALPTGFRDLDRLMNGGMKPGQMVVVAGRPGSGKSTLSVDIVREACFRKGKKALFFSLEMTSDEINQRMLAAEADIPLGKIIKKQLNDSDWTKITNVAEYMKQAELYIDDSSTLTMLDIRAKVRQISRSRGVDIVVIDYLQLLTSGQKADNRQHEVSVMSRQVKNLAKEIEAPIIAVCQLNRGVEQRGEEATPQISDLRESGSIEQDASVVCLVNRPDSKNPDHERAGECDFIVAKNRSGPLGTVVVAHQLHRAKFVDPPHQ